MKKSLLLFILLLSISWISKAQNMVLEFTTTAAGQSISLPLFDDGVTSINCEVNWGDLTPNTTVTTGALTPHTFTSVGTYQVQISGTLPKFGNGSAEWAGVLYLKKVLSFGSVGLTSLGGAFNNADNLTEVPATLPATITDLSNAFYKCGKASITNLNLWDVSHVTTMGNMFQEATAFNQYIGDWNTSSLTTMGMMFYGCSAFNQNINTKVVNEGLPNEYIAWDVSHVTHMGWVFTSCLVFNQDIGNWNTSNVTGAMYGMFNKARAFNKDISTKTVTLSDTTYTAWDVSGVTDMNNMLKDANAFNQNIGNWDVGNVTNMSRMFINASVFNQNIGSWDVSNVTNMSEMFSAAPLFNQNIGNWDISQVTNMTNMFLGATLSTTNYDALLNGWAAQAVQPNVVFNAGNSKYSFLAEAARGTLTTTNTWTITDGGMVSGFPMMLEYTTTGASQIVKLYFYGTVNCNVDWGDGSTNSYTTTGPKSHTYTAAGTYIVQITGTLTQFGGNYYNTSNQYLRKVITFGNTGLTSLKAAFSIAHNLTEVPASLPSTVTSLEATFLESTFASVTNLDLWDVSHVTNMNETFELCVNFNQNISAWNTGNVETMWGMFQLAAAFNQPIGSWNVSKVTDMSNVFSNCTAFNQSLSAWDVSSATNMGAMFSYATAFNQDISGWDVSSVTYFNDMFYHADAFNQNIGSWVVSSATSMENMFFNAVAFNQDISSWNVGSVTNMAGMFNGATSFNQDISNWNVASVTTMADMFNGVTLTTPVYDAILNDWSALSVQSNVVFDGGNSKYSSAAVAARNTLDITKSWTITDGGYLPNPMKLVFVTTAPSTEVGLPLDGTVNVTVKWGDGNSNDYTTAGIQTHTFATAGTYTVEIGGSATTSGILTTYGGYDNIPGYDKLTSVIDFGEVGLTSLYKAFNQATALTDVPASLPATVTNLSQAFSGASSFNDADIAGWNVGNVTNMTGMFEGVTLSRPNYDAILIGWAAQTVQPNVVFNAGNSQYTSAAVNARNTLTNVPNSWTITDGGQYLPMILEFTTTASNTLITLPLYGDGVTTVDCYVTWDDGTAQTHVTANTVLNHTYVSPGTHIVQISGVLPQFGYSSSILTFLTKVSSFGEIGLTKLYGAFRQANNLTEVPAILPASITKLQQLFENSTVTSVTNLNLWDVSHVTSMDRVFYNAQLFNQDISNWNVSNVTSMPSMFRGARSFNQDISGWNVGNVTIMNQMFNGATDFNQNLGGWNVGLVTNMTDMFKNVTLSTSNYDAILNGWAAQAVKPNVLFNGGNSKYSSAAVNARNTLTNAPNSWTITDGGQTQPMILEFTTTAASQLINLPLYGTVDCYINWGDGNLETVLSEGLKAHTYASAGTYQVEISGTLSHFGHSPIPGIQYLRKVLSFGVIGLTSLEVAFSDADNLTEVPATLPVEITNLNGAFLNCDWASLTNLNLWDVSHVTLMSEMFSGCSTFNQNISGWNVSSVTNMSGMFQGATSFNQNIASWNVGSVINMSNMFNGATAFAQNIGSWDISDVTNMSGMFEGVTLSKPIYDAILNGWAAQTVQPNVNFHAGSSQYTSAAVAARSTLTNAPNSWTITDGGQYLPMILEFTTTAAGQSITLPLYGYESTAIDCYVTWDDGTDQSHITSNTDVVHTYSAAGTHMVEISGILPQLGNASDNLPYLTKVTSFGSVGLQALYGAFRGADLLAEVPAILPASVTNMYMAFGFCDQPSITNLDLWDMSHVTSMERMFYNATTFNMDISDWDVSNVTTMKSLFRNCQAFNQDISSWDVSKVTDMSYLYYQCFSFNQDIGNWDVSQVTDMSQMFYGAGAFNQDIGGWEVSNVTNMYLLFAQSTQAGSPQMSFNQDIGGWDVSKVTSMKSMFSRNIAFNQDLNNWDVSHVTTMEKMFNMATSFNQNIANWNVSAVLNMSYMFSGATDFDQNLGTWNVASVTTMTEMFNGVTLSTSNYDALLIGWATQVVQPNVIFHGGNSQYSSAAVTARNTLDFAPNNWTITDGGQTQPMILEFTTTAAGQTISLPLFGTVDCYIIWDDGNLETVVSEGIKAHTYASAGTYQVEISGNLTHFGNSSIPGIEYLDKVLSFGDIGLISLESAFCDADNLMEVPATLPADVTNLNAAFLNCDWASLTNLNSWDVSHVTLMSEMFSGCVSFNQNISAWNVSGVTNMAGMFMDCHAFNQPIASWNVSAVTDMSMMFYSASSFNQDLSTWNIAQVTAMNDMFELVTLSKPNYDAILIGWAAQTVQPNVVFNAGNSQYTSAAVNARSTLTSAPKSWTITDGGQYLPMILEFTTTAAGQSISLPLFSDGVTPINAVVIWGDGTPNTTVTTGALTPHTYTSAGTYQVEISGTLPRFGNIDLPWSGREYLKKVISFGEIGLTSLSGAFISANNLIEVPAILPATVTNLYYTFAMCEWVTLTNLNFWDVSPVTNMAFVFASAFNFNQDISGWNVSNVTDMSRMFSNAAAFNQDISGWTTTSLTNMAQMFFSASSFNQEIGNWDVSNVTQMDELFAYATSFNGDIGGWDISSVTFIRMIFNYASSFNQDISNWNMSNVTDASSMFYGASSFNQPIGNWDVGSVTDMSYMFREATSFNQDISSKSVTVEGNTYTAWNVGSVTLMTEMFRGATSFNQNIGNWNTSAATNMLNMFKGATSFNQNISAWNVSNVTYMYGLFDGATSFNQNLGAWNVAAVTNMTNMFKGVTLSNSNYDAILTGWAAQPVKTNVTFHGGYSKYSSAAVTARNTLDFAPNNWTITDGGLLPTKTLTLSGIMLQGLYAGSNTMNEAYDENGIHWAAGVADHITVELHDASAYSTIIYTASDVALSTSGDAEISIPSEYSGSYYITIKHRNSIETVSANPVSFFDGEISQSFASQANVYGDNLIEMIDGTFCIFGGDVNQDGAIDGSDFSPIDNSVNEFAMGYLTVDANGDGSVDGSDFAIIDNNVQGFISAITP